ncbi:carboxymuconolactone decarboxylase family protein [Chryseobacterium sp. PTM-20240506]|uniref:carboxymuconolactone decarboxylase family protein n=1 Tax=unclassified Chryseobacterium TaxID=2593645 RepID=UPI002359771B|nr:MULTISPECIES: carboxymuconolactone decarboxylase family protein [unclassified Chryseobacterium]MDC8103981.1 carboxymuconolactone decarboxylase family protein [Chryseobacterium sp. B21-037]MDQ1803586.1 carboxymuconolactone decarboxylase family protein [Chryseobacterium sp. CKR4-1]WBV57522.1 carboxymuconolactone decarboxylase family protein [Chryseobacterium daecheongense]
MKNFQIPQKEQLSEANQNIFNQLEKGVGFVPNLYATFAHSENGLATYLALQNAKSSLKAKEKEVVNLIVSQYNNCLYCLSAHTAIAKLNGFDDDQILEIRKAKISFDSKLNSLGQLVYEAVSNKGEISEETKNQFFNEGYTEGHLVDVIIAIGDKTITNYLFAATKIPVDWPLAPEL